MVARRINNSEVTEKKNSCLQTGRGCAKKNEKTMVKEVIDMAVHVTVVVRMVVEVQ